MIQVYTFVKKCCICLCFEDNLFFYLKNCCFYIYIIQNNILTELTFMLFTAIYIRRCLHYLISSKRNRSAILEFDSLSVQVKLSQILPLIIIYN